MRNDRDDDYGIEPLLPGDPERIGAYRLLGRLGAGGMGRVFLARSEGGRTVAVKMVHEQLAADLAFRARFRREIEAARRVSERFTAPVLDAEPDGRNPWVATGYVAGPSLEQVVRSSGHLGTDEVLGLADGMLRALAGIHEARIVHRDLKPSNVMVTVHGPKIIDFGIARAVQTSVESLLTSTGMVIGSPGFMAPEQVVGDPVGPEADVFALGCLLTYAATGRLPFGTGASNQHAVMYQIVESPPDLDAVDDPFLRQLIESCLTKAPSERPVVHALLERIAADGRVGSAGAAGAADGAVASWLPPELVARIARQTAAIIDRDVPAVRSAEPSAGDPRDSAAPEPGDSAAPADPEGPTGPTDPADPAGSADSAAPEADGPETPDTPDADRPDVPTVGLRPEREAKGPAGGRVPVAVPESASVDDASTPPPSSSPTVGRRATKRRIWAVAAAAVAVVLIGGGVALLQRGDGDTDASGGRPGASAAGPSATATADRSGSADKGKDGKEGKDNEKDEGKGKDSAEGDDKGEDGAGKGDGASAPAGSGNDDSPAGGGSGAGEGSGGGTGSGGGGSGGGGKPPAGGDAPSSGSVPGAFLGTWTRETHVSGGDFTKVVVRQAAPNETVMTLSRDYGNSCVARATLIAVQDGGKRLSVSAPVVESGMCTSSGAGTWFLDGGLRFQGKYGGPGAPFQRAG
ncbi:protein kinase domain-containing protein [Streptomyces triticagri]|uniref:protein kinase domain-containing protein n=1 Tax=Streptomyces triticagri TaxID=2293568 RepID=UPI001F47ED42|nr:protein kinase [Streptomyces triticagri]